MTIASFALLQEYAFLHATSLLPTHRRYFNVFPAILHALLGALTAKAAIFVMILTAYHAVVPRRIHAMSAMRTTKLITCHVSSAMTHFTTTLV